MRPHLLAPVVALCLSLPLRLPAQETGAIRGRVTDAATGQPVADARLTIEGTALAAASRGNGEYAFPAVPAGAHVVVARRVGYAMARQQVNVVAGQTATADFELRAAAVALDVVVVTGTGAPAERRVLGNTIDVVQGEAVSEAPGVTAIDVALQGKIAGAWVSENSGQPGGGVSIRLRGASSILGGAEPLYVVDGVIVDNDAEALVNLSANAARGGAALANRLGDIDPGNIERIEVLKGAAAAALYGSRANAGVIQIFTKRGRQGEAQMQLRTTVQALSTPKRYSLLMYPQAGFGDVAVSLADSVGQPVQRYDIQDQIFQTGMGVTTQLSISGGTGSTTYHLSGSRTDEEGILRSTAYERTSVTARLTQQVSPRLEVSGGGNFIQSHADFLTEGEQGVGGVLTSVVFTPTTFNPNFDANQGRYPYHPIFGSNPLDVIDNWESPEDVTRFIGSAQATFKPTRTLTLRGLVGIDDYRREVKYFIPPQATSVSYTGSITNPVQFSRQLNTDVTVTHTASPTPAVGLTTTLGFRYTSDRSEVIRAAASDLPPGQTLVGGATQFASQGVVELRTMGGFLEERASIDDALFLTAGLNADASSAFGSDQRWQYFPRLSASYLLSETDFFRNSTFARTVSTLRLRAAYGQTGGQPPGAYARFANYADVVYSGKAGLVASTLAGNERLKPERQREIEAGFEAGLFEDRAVAEFTYYHQRVTDLVLEVPLPPSTGFQSQLQNVGELTNRGWEAALTTVNVNTPAFSWRSRLLLGHNRNRVERLVTSSDRIPFGYLNVVVEGQPLGVFYGGTYLRDAAGNIVYDTAFVTRGAVIDTFPDLPVRGPSRVIGDPNPDLIASLSNTLQLGRELELSVLFEGRFGNDVANFTRRITELFGVDPVVQREITGDTIPRTFSRNPAGRSLIYEEYIEDGGFVKLREVTLRYRLDAAFVRSLGAEDLTLSLAGRNLVTWTDYRGLDPEVNLFGHQTVARGVDFANTPLPRQFSFTVTVGF